MPHSGDAPNPRSRSRAPARRPARVDGRGVGGAAGTHGRVVGRDRDLLVQAGLELSGGAPLPWHLIGAQEWAYLAVYGIGSLAIAQLLFLIGVAGLGVGVATMHMNIAPFYVMVLALAFGAGWNWAQVGAAGLVVLGVVIAQGRGRRHA